MGPSSRDMKVHKNRALALLWPTYIEQSTCTSYWSDDATLELQPHGSKAYSLFLSVGVCYSLNACVPPNSLKL